MVHYKFHLHIHSTFVFPFPPKRSIPPTTKVNPSANPHQLARNHFYSGRIWVNNQTISLVVTCFSPLSPFLQPAPLSSVAAVMHAFLRELFKIRRVTPTTTACYPLSSWVPTGQQRSGNVRSHFTFYGELMDGNGSAGFVPL